MLKSRSFNSQYQQGMTLLEVLISLVILAFGILVLANLQGKIQLSDIESYQRTQAILLLSDMTDRINSHRLNAASYASATTIGTGDSQPSDCTGISSTVSAAARDICEWSNELKGANEKIGSTNTGAMTNARGCITQLQAPDSTAGICTPGIYQIAVVWQGMVSSATPTITCGQNLYGSEALRRVISSQITVGLTSCQ
ncbi:type IV pilus modification protein PilV [Tolumonas lignilytica]|uniref:type IV pilus modification protein PilV n=1 Tax=Tolumonas lignilytica TaxID=1283284 RepID=UPI0004679719|nr:type IV pilus modification protein PilV [Tolumonas lignilytica]